MIAAGGFISPDDVPLIYVVYIKGLVDWLLAVDGLLICFGPRLVLVDRSLALDILKKTIAKITLAANIGLVAQTF